MGSFFLNRVANPNTICQPVKENSSHIHLHSHSPSSSPQTYPVRQFDFLPPIVLQSQYSLGLIGSSFRAKSPPVPTFKRLSQSLLLYCSAAASSLAIFPFSRIQAEYSSPPVLTGAGVGGGVGFS